MNVFEINFKEFKATGLNKYLNFKSSEKLEFTIREDMGYGVEQLVFTNEVGKHEENHIDIVDGKPMSDRAPMRSNSKVSFYKVLDSFGGPKPMVFLYVDGDDFPEGVFLKE